MTDPADTTPLDPPPSTSPVVNADELASTAAVYRLLARLWLREVDLPLLQELARPPLRDHFQEAGGKLPDTIDPSTIDDLAIEYCRLFIGPSGHLPPYQSVWQSGQLQSQTVTSMQTFFDITGYQSPDNNASPITDHLGIQLDLAGHIAEQYVTVNGDASQFELLRDLHRSYFASHLLWPAGILQAAASVAESDFYRSIIRLTESFLQSESQELQLATPSPTGDTA